MNNLKKIGLTALAGSLVATTEAVAGEMSATGSASMKVSNNSNSAAGKTVGMANSVVLAGSGELDNGMTVSMSFELDSGVDTGSGTGPFDSHHVSVSSDAMGTLTVNGHGGSNAASALDTTAAGDLWDNSLGLSTGATGTAPKGAASGDNLVSYTLPTLADGVSISASYASDGENLEGSTAFGLTYTGMEGLTVSLGQGNNNSTVGVDIEQTVMSASYAFGSFTVGYSNNDYDHTTAANDQETTSYNVAYTLSDSISISYGMTDIDNSGDTAEVEVTGVTGSYTSGGMTVSATSIAADNVDGSSTGTDNDNEYWKLAASFAF
jgi:outer membrane protein OmpU